jgi:hypothetical protein
MKVKLTATDMKSGSLTCSECGKIFSGRDEATCTRFFKLHLKKSHPNANGRFEDDPRNIKQQDAEHLKKIGMDIRQVKVRLG